MACRTAADVGASAVLCLAFPVHPPGKGDDPSKSRLGELDAVTVPVLVVQGESDPFGMPPDAPSRTVVRVQGNHSLRDARRWSPPSRTGCRVSASADLRPSLDAGWPCG